MSGFGSSILIEAAPPRLPAWLMRSAGWLYEAFVADTSSTADAESRAPSFEVMDMVGIASSSSGDRSFAKYKSVGETRRSHLKLIVFLCSVGDGGPHGVPPAAGLYSVVIRSSLR